MLTAGGTPQQLLLEVVTEELASLGSDAQQVVDTFAAAGVLGDRNHAAMNPLCRWLHRRQPQMQAWLHATTLRV